jgi:hypothetical protein
MGLRELILGRDSPQKAAAAAGNEKFKWPWLQTYTGRSFIPQEPAAEDIDIRDIAIGLAREARYNGHTHTKIAYSVAQHSYYASVVVPKHMALWGLMHDAVEAYCKDLTWSVKTLLPEYKVIEHKIEKVIAAKYGLQYPPPPEIKVADNRLLSTEQRDLMAKPPRSWQELPKPYAFKIIPWDEHKALAAFLTRFNELTGSDVPLLAEQWDDV